MTSGGRLGRIALYSAMVLCLSCGDGGPVGVDDLHRPRGLASHPRGDLLVAEVGSGRILSVRPDGRWQILAEGLPVTWDGGPGGDSVIGVSGLDFSERGVIFVVGEFRGERFRRAYVLEASGRVTPLTSASRELSGEGLVNPYDVTSSTSSVFISDAGANSVFLVRDDGGVELFARIADVRVPEEAGTTADSVPTGITVGPDGALYVATLTGAPFPSGGASIVRLIDLNSDGDASDEDEQSIAVSGLTAATDVTFSESGWMLTTEFSLGMGALYADLTAERAARLTGRVTAWCGHVRRTLSTDVITPTAVMVHSGAVVVSEEFAGRVSELESPDFLQRKCDAWSERD